MVVRNRARSSTVRLPIVPPRKATRRPSDFGESIEVDAEVADHAGDLDGRVGLGQRGDRGAQGRLGDVEGDEPAQGAGVDEGVDQGHGLVGRSRAQLDRVEAPQRAAISGA